MLKIQVTQYGGMYFLAKFGDYRLALDFTPHRIYIETQARLKLNTVLNTAGW